MAENEKAEDTTQAEYNGWRVLIAYRKWLGWIVVGLVVVIMLSQGWIDEGFIGRMTDRAVRIIQALVPGS